MTRLFKFTSRNFITDRWLQNNPEAIIECWQCGIPIQKDDPRRKFCTDKCKKRYWRATNKKINYKYCDWCGDEFIAPRSDQVYDTIKCRRAADRKRRGIPILIEVELKCAECRELFNPKHPAQKYCSFSCFYVHRLRQKRIWNRQQRGSSLPTDTRSINKEKSQELKAAIERLKQSKAADTFDPDAWNVRAKEVEDKLALKWGQSLEKGKP